MRYKVLIVEDQKMPRQLFETYVTNSDNYELVYSLNSAEVADTYCAKFDVDLVIMDVVMNDGSNGLDAAVRIKSANPEIKVLIVTSMPEVSYLDRARRIGVDSFWYKEIEGEPLLEVMDRTMAGEHVYPDSTPTLKVGDAISSEFTKAELMVLRELTTGAGNKEIADRLHISVNTVRGHIQHMLDKTGFDNRTELAIQARLTGIVIADNR